jgi:hypothetical protein
MDVTTTRERLIAALLTAGKFDLKMPTVKPSRIASPYRRRFGLGDARGNLITAGEINSHAPGVKLSREHQTGRNYRQHFQFKLAGGIRFTASVFNLYLPGVMWIRVSHLGRIYCRHRRIVFASGRENSPSVFGPYQPTRPPSPILSRPSLLFPSPHLHRRRRRLSISLAPATPVRHHAGAT